MELDINNDKQYELHDKQLSKYESTNERDVF